MNRPLSPSKSRQRGDRRLLSLEGPTPVSHAVYINGIHCGCDHWCVENEHALVTDCDKCNRNAPDQWIVEAAQPSGRYDPAVQCCVPFDFVLAWESGCTWKSTTFGACGTYDDLQWVLTIATEWVTLVFDFGDLDPGKTFTYRARTDEWSCLCSNRLDLDRDGDFPPGATTGCKRPPCSVCIRPNHLGPLFDCCDDRFPRLITYTVDTPCSSINTTGQAVYNWNSGAWEDTYAVGPAAFKISIKLCNDNVDSELAVGTVTIDELVMVDGDFCPSGQVRILSTGMIPLSDDDACPAGIIWQSQYGKVECQDGTACATWTNCGAHFPAACGNQATTGLFEYPTASIVISAT